MKYICVEDFFMNGYIHMYCIAWSKIIKQWVSILVRCVTWRSFLNRFYAEDAFEQSDHKTRASRISVISCLIVRCSLIRHYGCSGRWPRGICGI